MREQSSYARKRAAGRVPRRYSERYYAWRADVSAGRDATESSAAWAARYAPNRPRELRLAA